MDPADARSDVVGSLLRPKGLLEARARWRDGRIDAAQLKAAENQAVLAAIALQEGAGLAVATDGEYRRAAFFEQFVAAVEGIEEVPAERAGAHTLRWRNDSGGRTTGASVSAACTGRLRRRRSLSAGEFAFLRDHLRRAIPKVTLPAPSLLARYWVPGLSEGAYPARAAYDADVVAVMREELAELVGLGARYIQFDAPNYPQLADPAQAGALDRPVESVLDGWVEMDNAVLAGFPGVVFGIHMCRGNLRGMWAAEGGYDWLAARVLGRLAHQRYLLEYDSDRAGSFAPLADIPEDRRVVLGLVSTKVGAVEGADELLRRIQAAARFVPLDRLALSPQCGFASVDAGNPIPWAAQEAKLALVARVAGQVWR